MRPLAKTQGAFRWYFLLLWGSASLCACHSDPNRAMHRMRDDPIVQASKARGDNGQKLYQGTSELDPEKQEYARLSRERLRTIEARARELTAQPQAIARGSEGDVAATLNLLPSKCDETEREIETLETITSPKWQHKRQAVDSKLANLERSLDRAQLR